MKRQSFLKLTLVGIGYVILGNVLCLFMTMGFAMFGGNAFTNVLSIICGALIFFLLTFTVAWKDGVRERSLVSLKRVDRPLKYRWVLIGLVMYVFAAVPTIVLLINKLFVPNEDFLLAYRFLSGSAYPFIITFVPPLITESEAWVQTAARQIDNMSVLFPCLMLLYYALIPVSTQLGSYMGYNDLLNKDRIMYK